MFARRNERERPVRRSRGKWWSNRSVREVESPFHDCHSARWVTKNEFFRSCEIRISIVKRNIKGFKCLTVRLETFWDFSRLLEICRSFWDFWGLFNQIYYCDILGHCDAWCQCDKRSHFDQTLNSPKNNFQTCRTVRDTLSRSKIRRIEVNALFWRILQLEKM